MRNDLFNFNRKAYVLVSAVLLLILFSSSLTLASLNVSLSNQGTDVRNKTSGSLLSTGSLRVLVYDSPSGGSLIYDETFPNGISNGQWNVMLGENGSNPLSLEFGKKYWMDYRINGEDVNFTNLTSSNVDRQFFYAPLGDIAEEDINPNTNLTIGQKITFSFNEMIDNIVDGYLRFTGNVNITNNLTVAQYVSIGSETPTDYPLTVYTNANDRGIALYNTATSNLLTRIGRDGSNDRVFQQWYNNGIVSAQILGNGTTFFNAAGGNVGIGTSGPEALLHLIRDSADSELRLQRTGSGAGTSQWIITGTGDTQFGPASSGDSLDFQTTGIPRLRIDSSGNVGIGTTSPEDILHVSQSASGALGPVFAIDNPAGAAIGNEAQVAFLTDGGASVSGTSNVRLRAITRDSGTGAVSFQIDTWDGGSEASRIFIDSSGKVGINTTSPSQLLHVAGNANVTGNLYAGTFSPNNLVTGTLNTTGQTLLATSGGNVGIGTASPTRLLQVQGSEADNRAGIRINNTNTNAGYWDIVVGDGFTGIGNGSFALERSGLTAPLVIQSDGDIGLGTSSPSNKLEVVGTPTSGVLSKFTSSSDTRNAIAVYNPTYFTQLGTFSSTNSFFAANNSGFVIGEAGLNLIGGSESPIVFATNASLNSGANERMRITPGGNVGIGTTSPLRVLHSVGAGARFSSDTASPTSLDIAVDEANSRVEFATQDAGGSFGAASLTLKTNSQNVGIGTTSPSARLEILQTSDGKGVRINSTDADDITLDIITSSTRGLYLQGLNTAITDLVKIINASSSTVFIAQGNGKVGIGTANPANALNVLGDTNITGQIYYQNEIVLNDPAQEDWAIGSDSTANGLYFYNIDDGQYRLILRDDGSVNVTGTLYAGTFSPSTISTNNLNTSSTTHLATSNGKVTIGSTDAALINYGLQISNDDGSTALAVSNRSGAKRFALNNLANGGWTLYDAGTGSFVAGISQYQGKLGISTTSPSEKLEVNGGNILVNGSSPLLKIQNNADATYGGGLRWLNNAGTSKWAVGPRVNVATDAFEIAEGASTRIFIQNVTGNVGIGTTTPSTELEINGSGFVSTLINAAGTGDPQLSLNNDGTGKWSIGSDDDDSFKFYIRGDGGGADQFLTIDQSGNVGMGTTNPQSHLHISGSSTQQIITQTDGNSVAGLRINTPLGNWSVGLGRVVNDEFDIYDESASASRLHISSTGKVGIGTTAPGTVLGSDNALVIAGNDGPALVINDTGQAFPYTFIADGNALSIAYGGTRILRIGDNGNVGIGLGTATPANKLNVLGDANITGTLYAGTFTPNGLVSSTLNVSGQTLLATSSGNVGIGTTSPLDKFNVKVATNENLVVRDHLGAVAIDAVNDADNAFADLKIRSAKTLFTNGNVGIGTTNPSNKLTINASTLDGVSIIRSDQAIINSTFLVDNQWQENGFSFKTSGFQTLFMSAADGDVIIGDIAAGPSSATGSKLTVNGGVNIGFAPSTTAPSDGLLVETNVGIGTSSPNSGTKLHLSNTDQTELRIENTASNNAVLRFLVNDTAFDPRILFGNSTADNLGAIEFDAGNKAITFSTNGLNERMRIDSSGRVGIGTASPSAPLHVSGAASQGGNIYWIMRADYGNTAGTIDDLFSIATNSDTAFGIGLDVNTTDSKVRFRNLQSNSPTDVLTLSYKGNVGIGTTSPEDYRVHITSDALGTASMLLLNNSFTNSNPHIRIQNDARHYTIQTVGARNDNFEIMDSTVGSDASAVRLAIDTSGNVGIGTTTPSHLLTVVGDVNLNNTLYVNKTAGKVGIKTADPSYNLDVRGGNEVLANFQGTGSPRIQFYDGTNNALVIGTSGGAGFLVESGQAIGTGLNVKGNKIGINTTTPSQLLEVAGNANVTGTLYAETFNPSNVVTSTLNVSGQTLLATSSGRVGIGTAAPFSNHRLTINQGGDAYGIKITNPANSQNLTLGATDPEIAAQGGNLYIRATPNNIFLADNGGNIGIGTTSPSSKLHIKGAFSNQDALRLENTGNNTYIQFASGESNVWTTGIDDVDDTGGNDFYWFLSPSVRMMIKDNGNVGIGTTSPGQPLHINSSGSAVIRLDALGDSDNIGYVFNNGTYVGLGSNAGTTGHKLLVSRNAPDNALVIAGSSGNVGIGTANPTGIFHINATSGHLTLEDKDEGGSLRLERDTSGFNIDLISSNTNLFRITDAGNVGIGTASPGFKFVVNTSVADWTAKILNTNSGAYGLSIENLGSESGFGLAVYTGAGTGFFVRNTGDVGIGTAEPSNKLNVVGDANITSNLNVGGTFTVSKSAPASTVAFVRNTNAADGFGLEVFAGTASTEANYILQLSDGSNNERFRFTSSGKLGIGTTSPNQLLHVAGNANITGTLYAETFNPSNVVTSTLNVSGQTLLATSSGNVGIGTTTPSALLELKGSAPHVQITGNDARYIRFTHDTGLKYNFLVGAQQNVDNGFEITPSVGNGTTNFSTPAFVVAGATRKVGIGTSTPDDQLEIKTTASGDILRLSTSADGGQAAEFGIDTTNKWFYLNPDSMLPTYNIVFLKNGGATPIMFWNQSSGNVGIGSSSPNALLQIHGGSPSASTDGLQFGTDSSANLYRSTTATIKTDGSLDVAGSSLAISSNAAKLLFYNGASNFTRDLSGRLDLNLQNDFVIMPGSSGNIGIGTTSPSNRLTVQSSDNSPVRIIGNGGAGGINSAISFNASALQTAEVLRIGFRDDSTNKGAFIETLNNGNAGNIVFMPHGTNAMLIQNTTNNVGIGTTAPGVRLHVQQAGEGATVRIQDSDGTCDLDPDSGSLVTSCSSDEELKRDIKDAKSALEEFKKIKVRDYTVKVSGKETTGVIAQEVEEVAPELVHEEGGILFVEQPNPWKLLKAIQELQAQVEALSSGNNAASTLPSLQNGTKQSLAGQIEISPGFVEARIEFGEKFNEAPIVTVTPVGLPNFFYGVKDVDASGFSVVISGAQTNNVVFTWQASFNNADLPSIQKKPGNIPKEELIVEVPEKVPKDEKPKEEEEASAPVEEPSSEVPESSNETILPEEPTEEIVNIPENLTEELPLTEPVEENISAPENASEEEPALTITGQAVGKLGEGFNFRGLWQRFIGLFY